MIDFVSLLLLFIGLFQTQAIHAPELVRGKMVSVTVANLHVGHIDGGDLKAVMIGHKDESEETGFIYTINYQPVPYSIKWKNEHKFIGVVDFRGHDRKLCGANVVSNLPCK